MEIVFLIVGIAMGAVGAWLAMRSAMAQLRFVKEQQEQSLNENSALKQQLAQAQTERTKLSEEKAALQAQCGIAETRAKNLSDRLEETRIEAERRIEELRTLYKESEQKLANQQQEQLKQQSKLISEQINNVSERILKERSEELNSHNREQLAAILNPLHDNLNKMREAVEKSDREQSDRLVSLNATIKESIRQAQEVGQSADRLAQALTNENKAQGNFGELRLSQLLENMGFEKGVQYEEQVTMRENGQTITEEDGHRLQPDVILHFPDSRDVIIDSKMSLKAFQDYSDATDKAAKAEALARHIDSMRKHARELANKKYAEYTPKGRAKLDFVVMYVFNEGAVQLALSQAPTLWKEAYDMGVIISGSQNLYLMLRVLEMTWRQVHQAENQEEIMKAADDLVNRVQMFYERLQAVDDSLQRTRKSFDDLKNTTAPSGKGIAVAARKLLKFGAKENPKRKARIPLTQEEVEQDAAELPAEAENE